MFGIKNLPNYAMEYKYFVVREIEGELWFYGAYNNETKANEVAYSINGAVYFNEEI